MWFSIYRSISFRMRYTFKCVMRYSGFRIKKSRKMFIMIIYLYFLIEWNYSAFDILFLFWYRRRSRSFQKCPPTYHIFHHYRPQHQNPQMFDFYLEWAVSQVFHSLFPKSCSGICFNPVSYVFRTQKQDTVHESDLKKARGNQITRKNVYGFEN